MMEFKYVMDPLPHIIIDNFFNEEDLKEIWQELDFLTYSRKLLPPSQTASDTMIDEHGEVVYKKNNMGIFLDGLYTNREVSNILNLLRNKFFTPEMMKNCEECHYIFRYLSNANMDSTLLSYYESGGHYAPHIDHSAMTVLMWFHKEPKQFTGGDLVFSEYNHVIPFQNNRILIMPSIALHQVTEVVMNPGVEPMKGFGRYVITDFARFR